MLAVSYRRSALSVKVTINLYSFVIQYIASIILHVLIVVVKDVNFAMEKPLRYCGNAVNLTRNRTQMTQIKRICTDKIRDNQHHLCNPCPISFIIFFFLSKLTTLAAAGKGVVYFKERENEIIR